MMEELLNPPAVSFYLHPHNFVELVENLKTKTSNFSYMLPIWGGLLVATEPSTFTSGIVISILDAWLDFAFMADFTLL
jgi:hypothetical protein